MFLTPDEIKKQFELIQTELRRMKFDGNVLVGTDENHLVDSRLIISCLRSEDPLRDLLLEMIESSTNRCERASPGSGVEFLKALASNVDLFDDTKRKLAVSRYPTQTDLKKFIEQNPPIDRPVLRSVLENLSFNSNCFVRRDNVEQIVMEKCDGNIFNLARMSSFDFDERDVRCFVIDGFVESVAEIHRVLESASQNRSSVAIFARNFSPDVVSTVNHNVSSGRIRVLLVKVNFDVDEMNLLVDLAVISGADVVSSDKGDLIRSMTLEKAPIVQQVIHRGDRLMMINPKTARPVFIHRENIRKRASEASNETSKKLLENRLSSLVSDCFKIVIPNGKDNDRYEALMDSFFRTLSSALRYGVVQNQGIIVPTATFVAGRAFARKFKRMIYDKLGGAIVA